MTQAEAGKRFCFVIIMKVTHVKVVVGGVYVWECVLARARVKKKKRMCMLLCVKQSINPTNHLISAYLFI